MLKVTTDEQNSGMHQLRIVSVFGLTESVIVEKLAEFEQLFPRLKLEIKSNFAESRVRLSASQSRPTELKDSAAPAVDWICRKLGDHVYSDAGQSMPQVVGTLLAERHATLAVAESCTGGLIADMLTDVAGSSDYFLLSVVTYANQAKINVLGVSDQTLEKHGAVSEQTAGEMARGAKHIVNATYGLATSGIAGPGGETDGKPVGTVCIGLATPLSVAGHRFNFGGHNRRTNKQIFALTALDLLRKELLDRK